MSHRSAHSGLFRDAREEKIFHVAARLIRERGFDATSMNEIADAVNLTKAGLYYYVKGKQDLLYRIVSTAMGQLETHVVEPARQIADPEARLRAIISSHARLLTDDIGPLSVLTDEVGGLAETERREIIGRKRRYFELVRQTLDELQAAGKLRPVHTTVAAFSLLGTVMWIPRWYREGGELSGEEIVQEITRVALGNVLTDGTSEAVPAMLALAEP